MPKYSRSHERAECAKISRGLWESLFGLIFSWLPGVGLILSVAGFCRQAVRLTEVHRVRRFFSMIFASVVLVVSIGGLVGEAYLYSRDPNILNKTSLLLWQKLTGQEALPGGMESQYVAEGEDPLLDGEVPDEYHTADGQMEEGDVPVDGQMEEGDVPPAEGDFRDDVGFSEDDSDDTVSGGQVPAAADSTLPPLSDLLKSHGVTIG